MASDSSLNVLSHAARPLVVIKYLGELLIALAGLTVVPFLAALVLGEQPLAWRFLLVAAVLALVGVLGARLRVAVPIQSNEAMVVSALAYLTASLAMIWPFMAAGVGPLDAWFETMSGVTTTGLSTLAAVESMPRALVFTRAWMQWYGGLGIVVLTVSLLAAHDVSARRLVTPAAGEENLVTTTRVHARRMLLVYLGLSVAGIGLLLLLGLSPFDALCHTLAAISTGGFATHSASLAAFDAWDVGAAVLGISFCGAVALPLYYRARHEGWRVFPHDEEFRLLVGLTLVVAILVWAIEFRSANGIGHALLTAISAQTTTGFATTSIAELGPGTKAILLIAMASGGSLGSTAGGFKLWRLLIVWRMVWLWMRRSALPPHAVAELRIGGHRVESDEAWRASALILVFVATVLLSWVPFLVYGHDPLDSLFDVVSATATTGLSTGVVSPSLEGPLKVILSLDMWLGRLEFMAVLILLFLPTWRGKRGETK